MIWKNRGRAFLRPCAALLVVVIMGAAAGCSAPRDEQLVGIWGMSRGETLIDLRDDGTGEIYTTQAKLYEFEWESTGTILDLDMGNGEGWSCQYSLSDSVLTLTCGEEDNRLWDDRDFLRQDL
jgi:hypothetical protein